MSGAGCRLCAAWPSAAPARSLHFLARGSCAVAAQPQPSPVPHSDHGAPPPPGETTRLLTYYISSVLMPRHDVYCISIYICSQGLGRWWAGVQRHSPGQHRSALMSPAVAGPGWRRRHTLAHRYRRCPGPGTQSPASLATRQSHTAIQ